MLALLASKELLGLKSSYYLVCGENSEEFSYKQNILVPLMFAKPFVFTFLAKAASYSLISRAARSASRMTLVRHEFAAAYIFYLLC